MFIPMGAAVLQWKKCPEWLHDFVLELRRRGHEHCHFILIYNCGRSWWFKDSRNGCSYIFINKLNILGFTLVFKIISLYYYYYFQVFLDSVQVNDTKNGVAKWWEKVWVSDFNHSKQECSGFIQSPWPSLGKQQNPVKHLLCVSFKPSIIKNQIISVSDVKQ